MAAALFDDDFKARWYHALAWLWLAGLAWREMYGWPPAVVAVQEASSLLFVAFGVWHALAGRAGDLVEWRRQLRVEFAVITALYIVSLIVSQRIWPGTLGKPPYSLFNAIGLMAFVFVYAWLRLSLLIRQQLAPASPQDGRVPPVEAEPRQPPPATGQDAVLLEALRKLMVEGRAYREDGLSITSLSQTPRRSGIPAAPPDQRPARPPKFQRLRQRLSAGRGGGRTGRSRPGRGADPDHCARRRLRLDRAVQSGVQGPYRADADRIPARASRR